MAPPPHGSRSADGSPSRPTVCAANDELPGRQGRLLFAYLVTHRHEPVTLDALTEALWASSPPSASLAALHALLSKLRRVDGCSVEHGTVRLQLPRTRGSTSTPRATPSTAPNRRVPSTTGRGHGVLHRQRCSSHGAASCRARRSAGPMAVRHELELLRQRSLETYANAALHIGRAELATAERASRELIGLAPFRETAHRRADEDACRAGQHRGGVARLHRAADQASR